MKHKNREYQLCKNIAIYLRLQYPSVLYHFDLAGLNLSKTQAGMMKGIQGDRGFPDLMILEPRGKYHGLLLEVKAEDAVVFNRNGSMRSNEHLNEQALMISQLNNRGYFSSFGIGFSDCKNKIDNYLKLTKPDYL